MELLNFDENLIFAAQLNLNSCKFTKFCFNLFNTKSLKLNKFRDSKLLLPYLKIH